ncbi:MAG: rhomboid family intramembrane serine protease [Oscillospiraceae bacterium]|nr:rhomboid family intramembrane serine protease [Oscillospiraceae bacterium]
MKKRTLAIRWNAPVTLSFALISLAVLGLAALTQGRSTRLLFSVYRSPLSDALTYPRFFLHVLGHSGISHYTSNVMLLLVLGPGLEERFGSESLLKAMAVTAFVTGLLHWLLFPGTALLGASGVVFMMILMASQGGMHGDGIPLTLILVFLLYVGSEVWTALAVQDNVSHLTHIVGGVCGAVLGLRLRKK